MESSKRTMGKQAYLLEQAARFDMSYATPHRVTRCVILGILVAAAILGAYELLALVLNKRIADGA